MIALTLWMLWGLAALSAGEGPRPLASGSQEPASEATPAPQEAAQPPHQETEGNEAAQEAEPEAAAPVEEGVPPVPPGGDEGPTANGAAAVLPGPFDAPFSSYDDYTRRLRAWSDAAGERVGLEAIGASLGGRELLAVSVDAADERPAVALAVHPTTSLEGARALLLVMDAWLTSNTDLRALPSLLGLPCIDPDGTESGERAPAGSLARVRIERDFPSGWRPSSDLSGAGPYPFSRPESEAVARFLQRRGRIAAVVEGAPFVGGVELDASGGGALRADSGRRAGLLRFAHELLGVHTWEFGLPGGPRAGSAGEEVGPAWGEARAADLRATTARLPSLEFGSARSSSLGGGLWQVDVPLRNAGALPTNSGRGRAVVGAARIELLASGVEVLALAARSAPGVHEPVARDREGAWHVSDLGPDESLGLRLVVTTVASGAGDAATPAPSADEGAGAERTAPPGVALEARSQRARTARVRVELGDS